MERYHRQLNNLHIGCEKPRAYYIPFESKESCTAEREKSAFFRSLCGEWDFEYFENIEELDIENTGFSSGVVCHDKITVPMCWQVVTGKGYDVPNYINQDYPFPVDPPHLPDVIPCGFYRRKIDFAKKTGKKYYINFEGVASCFYLWINGKFTGYSQVSHSTSEFNITDTIADGENTIEVLVAKHCDGSYLEDQDFFRLSGIFRDVYILERDAAHLTDIYIDCNVSDNFNNASLTVKSDCEINYELTDADGKTVSSGICKNSCDILIENVTLWNPETPYIYTLRVNAGNEWIAFPVAVKRIEIQNRCLLLNGKKIKIKGVNRHDNHPETGYCVDTAHMERDLHILKQANVNTIRTSHYPNDPRFLDMCDKIGMMIIDEADLETHGMGYNYGDWYWDYWSFLSDSPDWTHAYLDRASRLFEPDKNHGCIIMWSLGNESGCGENHRKMAEFIRSRQPKAIIHYENARLEYQERVGKDFTDISDVESRMYASLEYMSEYLNDPESKKPFFYCEYVDSMSTGDIPLHWNAFEKYDNYAGGCVWEYSDHAVNIGTAEKPKYRYGGDFGDWPNDKIGCLDGLVYPDRSPRPGYFDMKITYQPFAISYKSGKITVKNKNYFASLNNIYFEWTIEKNGKKLYGGTITDTDIAPQSEKAFVIFDNIIADELTTLNVFAKLKHDAVWAGKDFETGFCQFILSDSPVTFSPDEKSDIITTDSRTAITIVCGKVAYTLDKLSGVISSINNGRELLKEPVTFAMWRGCTYNSGHFIDIWKRARYDHAKMKNYGVKIVEKSASRVVISADVSFAAAAMPPAVRAAIHYTFTSDGKLNISVQASVTENAPELPRFGLKIVMPKDFEKITYLGYGDRESYSDRFASTRLSEYNTTVTDNYEHYIKPQECSSHYKTKYAAITDGNGHGLKFCDTAESGFCFKALHYDDEQLLNTMHDDELVELDKTIIWLDYKIHASNQGLSYLEPFRKFDEKQFSFSYDIITE